jgi:hypothetical protein
MSGGGTNAPRGLFTALQQKLCRWSGDNLDAAAASRPRIPGALDDRQQDNWEILIAVADLAGGDWPAAARNAAISLSNSKEDTETLGVQLLHDVKTIVASSKDNGVYSIELLEELVKMPERPWSEINRGKQMTQNRLAKMPGAFGLKTKNLRIGDDVRRGYDLADLRAAFERYCPETPTQAPDSGETHTHPPDSGFQSATVLHDNNINDLGANQSATRPPDVALSTQRNQLKPKDVAPVALREPGFGHAWGSDLTMPLSDPNDDSAEAHRLRALLLAAADSTIEQTIRLQTNQLKPAAARPPPMTISKRFLRSDKSVRYWRSSASPMASRPSRISDQSRQDCGPAATGGQTVRRGPLQWRHPGPPSFPFHLSELSH